MSDVKIRRSKIKDLIRIYTTERKKVTKLTDDVLKTALLKRTKK